MGPGSARSEQQSTQYLYKHMYVCMYVCTYCVPICTWCGHVQHIAFSQWFLYPPPTPHTATKVSHQDRHMYVCRVQYVHQVHVLDVHASSKHNMFSVAARLHTRSTHASTTHHCICMYVCVSMCVHMCVHKHEQLRPLLTKTYVSANLHQDACL